MSDFEKNKIVSFFAGGTRGRKSSYCFCCCFLDFFFVHTYKHMVAWTHALRAGQCLRSLGLERLRRPKERWIC